MATSIVVPSALVGSTAHAASCAAPNPGLRAQSVSVAACDAGFVATRTQRLYSGVSAGRRLAHGHPLTLQVAGRAGVPATGVTAVALNVTAVQAQSSSYLTVWPAGRAKPGTTALNVSAGSTRSALVVSAVNRRGAVSIANAAGRTGVTVDVVGYYLRSTTRGSLYHPTRPQTLFDSGTVARGTKRLTLPSVGKVRSSRMSSALVNVTVTGAVGHGSVTLWSAGDSRPSARTLVFDRGSVVANSAVVRLSSGSLRVAVAGHAARVTVTLRGWYGARSLAGGRPFQALVPYRVSDTRATRGGSGALGPNSVLRVAVAGGSSALPADTAAVAVRLTAASVSAPTQLTAWATGAARPVQADLVALPGVTSGDLAVVPLSFDGSFSIYNSTGSTEVVADVVGYFRRTSVSAPGPAPVPLPVPAPAPTTGRYSVDLPPGLIYWGSAVGGNADPASWESSLGASLSARRTYFQWPANKAQLIRTLADDKAHHRLSAIAVKFGDWATVASGSQDASLRDFAATIKAVGVPVAVTPHHEPEGGGTGGVPDGPAPAFRAMVAHMLPIFRTAPNMSVGVCLMAWSFEPNSGKNVNDWWVPGVDFLGIDGYNYWGTSSKAKWKTPTEVFSKSADFADDHGVKMMVLETGVQPTDGVVGAPGSSYQWMLQLRDFLLARHTLGMTYFNSSLHSVAPWTLSGERLAAFEQVLTGPQIARAS